MKEYYESRRDDHSIMMLNIVIPPLETSKDIRICEGDYVTCPKKKQKCEISARCWRLGTN